MTFGMTLAERLTMAASASLFYIAIIITTIVNVISCDYVAIDYKNDPNMKVAVSNINIKIHQPF